METRSHITDAVQGDLLRALRDFTGGSVDGAVILGSGLGSFSDTLPCPRSMSTAELPGYPVSTVRGHSGALHLCTCATQRLLLFQGRVHGYEGYSAAQVTLPVRIAAALGAKKLLVTNAAGGLHPTFAAGDFMLITDVLSLPATSGMGLPLEQYLSAGGTPPRPLIAPQLLETGRAAAADAGVRLREGSYGFCSGPTYETRAEIAFFRLAGADAVGMSTLPEILAARLLGMDVLGLSCITNKALTVAQEVSHAEVTAVATRVADDFARLLRAMLERW
ncbi:MAG: purine-nucleoside phosphorylase [Bacteroidota bacterium]|nr:purine-nucleoside phosphorylase [Bacteroidota bacterium]